jgi:hypothetical protein
LHTATNRRYLNNLFATTRFGRPERSYNSLNTLNLRQPSFLDLVPDRRPLKIEQPGDNLNSGDIFHFLLPDSGMADYTDSRLGAVGWSWLLSVV